MDNENYEVILNEVKVLKPTYDALVNKFGSEVELEKVLGNMIASFIAIHTNTNN